VVSLNGGLAVRLAVIESSCCRLQETAGGFFMQVFVFAIECQA